GSHGRLDSNIKFKDNDQLNNLIFRIARATGESISEQNPMMNVTFQGFAISATLGVAGSSSRLVMTRL
ncbi:hypothetical protein CL616_01275, partial [archaeon]|nr:hypothetical protein [archaeon]